VNGWRDRALLIAWVPGLIVSAVWARPAAEWLRAQGVLTATVWGLSALGCMLIALLLRDRPAGSSDVSIPAALVTLAAGAWLATAWALPEERIHLAQYGPLGALVWRVLGARGLGLALLIGLGDEALQGALPDRTFDPWDVVANGTAASAGWLVVRGGKTSWAAPALFVALGLVLGAKAPGPSAPPTESPRVEQPPPAQSPTEAPYAGASILFITVDALRADRVPPFGRASVPTPAFDALASQSIAVNGVANALWTSCSMVSFFTGLNPATHGVMGRGQELGPSVTTPLETLGRAGWTVLGFAGDDSETYRNLGFQREIDQDRPQSEVVTEALSAGPTFLWLHLRDVHAPYDASDERLTALGLRTPPDSPLLKRARTQPTVPRADFPGDHAWLKPYVDALYDAELADADAALGRILAAVDDDVIVVLSADHGEELLERGGIGHASTTLDSWPWPELVDIPLLIRLPDRRHAGKRLDGAIQQVDVLPSLLPLIGLRPEPAAPGVPLDGRDLSGSLLNGTGVPSAPMLVHSSPCGWQCPDERRGERVTASWQGGWTRCADDCPPAVQQSLDAADVRRRSLSTPVASDE
jgi:arylsulfatase